LKFAQDKQLDFDHLVSLYNRASLDLEPSLKLFSDFSAFYRKTRNSTGALNVLERGVRALPFEGQLWVSLMQVFSKS
jgi:hypothetical protein